MKQFLRLLLANLLLTTHAFAGTQAILKADVIENQIGIKNYLGAKGHFEKNANGWSGYDDSAATPSDGTGGTVTTTCTRTTTTPLSGDGSFLYTPAALGEGCSASFTIDNADKGKVLTLSLDYAVVSGTYTDDDTQIWIYNVTDAVMIQPAPFKLKKHSLSAEKFAVEFQTSTSSTSYRVLIHQATAGTAVLKIDNMQLGPQAKLYGSAVTDWVSYTPTFVGLGTVSGLSASYRKNGDSMEVQFVVIAGTTTATAAYLTLPSGFSANLPTNSMIGKLSASATPFSGGFLVVTSDLTRVYFSSDLDNYTNGANGNTWANSTVFSGSFKVPILGWSSSQIMSSDASTRVVDFHGLINSGTHTSTGNWQAVPNFTSIVIDTYGSSSTSTNSVTIKTPGKYKITAKIDFTANSSGSRGARITKNGSAMNGSAIIIHSSSASFGTAALAIIEGDLVAGDAISFEGYQNSGGNLNYNNGTDAQSFLIVSMLQGPAQIAASETVSFRGTYSSSGSLSANSETSFVMNAETYDSHGSFDLTTFTAPISGTYLLGGSATLAVSSVAGGAGVNRGFRLGIKKGSDTTIYFAIQAPPNTSGAADLAVSGSTPIKLLAGETVVFKVFQLVTDATSQTLGGDSAANFVWGYRLGNY
jgi:hypothetical protein